MKLKGLTLTSTGENRCTVPFGLHPSFFALNRKCFFFLLFVLSWGIHLHAQLALKAKPLNVFIQPRQSETLDWDTIDVLSKSELSSCGVSSTSVRLFNDSDILGAGTALHGEAALNPVLKVITYKPAAGFIGQDSLKYSLTCGAQTDTAVVLINVGDKPEVVIDDACAVKPTAMIWDIQLTSESTVPVYPLATPFVGDLDGDRYPEVVVPGAQYANTLNGGYNYATNTIIVLNNDLTLRKEFPVPWCDTYLTQSMFIADVDNDEYGEIVVATTVADNDPSDQQQLICYDEFGERKWTTTVSFMVGLSNLNWISLIGADVNGDGWMEILAANKIYDGETGTLLLTLPAGGIGKKETGRDIDYSTAMPVFADIDNDGLLEVIGGNTTYKLNITNRNGTEGNTASVLASSGGADGWTSVADIDGDGDLDVLVSAGNHVYCWDGATSTQIGNTIYPGETIVRTSRIFAGDITGDGNVDFAFTYPSGMQAYEYNAQNNTFTQLWQKKTSDTSGITTMSMFDFDQNGESELVYRDETDLRIMNKYGEDITAGSCFSATHSEYPVIVDLDLDGHADIIVSGALAKTETGTNVRILKYSSLTPEQWAPARSVWNQHGYNPVYINDDLTAVRYPLNPATRFVDASGNYLQPFNNFLQQATLLNDEGTMLSYGPKLEYDNTLNPVIEYTEFVSYSSVNARFTVINTGDADFKGPLYISAYFLNGSDLERIQTLKLGEGVEEDEGYIKKGDSKSIVFTIDFSSLNVADPRSFFQIRLNDDGGGNPVSPLCSYFGTYSKPPFYAPDYFLRHGDNTIHYYPSESGYTYVWYRENPNVADKPASYGTGDSITFTAAHTVEEFYVEVYSGQTLVELRPPVNTYLVPDSLEWTGNAAAGSQDWHNPANWNYPHDPDPEEVGIDIVRYKVPGVYTNVLIPGKLTAPRDYPDLNTGKTSYDDSNIGSVLAPYTA
ncbi:MAG: VCBS repeat-containing protein, partial [Dysgonamonadaceae bacterium]|nr:VCBS repeat-containing protein [Dysgonamonadaceae bacterium]